MSERHGSTRIVLTSNTSWNVVNFRGSLIRRLCEIGYEVVVVAPPDNHSKKVGLLGARDLPLPMDNKGRNPLRDTLLLVRFFRLLQRESPVCLLGFTIKPNIYGSIAAAQLGIPVINNIAGL